MSVIAGSLCGWGQSGRKHLTEDDEWNWVYNWISKGISPVRPHDGFVPNAEIAKQIGEAVAVGIFGEAAKQERPFRARLKGDIWTVMGSLPHLALGGVAIIQISKHDGRVLFAQHTQ
jgi:hypothetical protein